MEHVCHIQVESGEIWSVSLNRFEKRRVGKVGVGGVWESVVLDSEPRDEPCSVLRFGISEEGKLDLVREVCVALELECDKVTRLVMPWARRRPR